MPITNKQKAKFDIILRKIPNYDPFKDSELFYMDYQKAFDAIFFFENALVHIKGKKAGQPFLLEDWQKAVIGNLFGWLRHSDGTRRYRECLIYIPRKNGKTILAAGIANYMFFMDKEMGSEIYCAAAEAGQARLCWDVAKQMILRNPLLNEKCHIYQNSIVDEATASFFKPISAEADTKHGYNIHCAVVDELHVQASPALVDVLETSTGSREQPVIIYLTTSDFERESICNDKYKYAKDICQGTITDHSFLPVVYEANAKADWKSEEVWKKANPNYGISLTVEYMERNCQKAINSARYQNTFKRLNLNIKTDSDVQWISMDKWNACDQVIDIEELKGKTCFAGLDLSQVSDLTAFVLFFPFDGNVVLPYCFIPREVARMRLEKNRVNYIAWASEGYMELTEGDTCDHEHIKYRINELGKMFNIQEIAFDRWGAAQIMTDLGQDGFEMIKFGQGYASMSAPAKHLEKLILDGDIIHNNHPVLKWCIGNTMVEEDPAGNIKPNKKTQGNKSANKIDPVVALVMAIGRAIVSEDNFTSIYDTRGIISIDGEEP